MGKLQNKLRTNPTRRPHSHPWSHHPASSAPSETGAGKRSTFTSANIFLQKNDLLRVYTLCFLRFCVFCFSYVCKFVEETKKKCLSHVISRILHSVGSLLVRLQCVGVLLGRSFCWTLQVLCVGYLHPNIDTYRDRYIYMYI